jgi:hypothetical protein
MDAHEDFLHDVVDVGRRSYAAGHVGPKVALELPPDAASFDRDHATDSSGAQQLGAQQEPPGFLPSIVADAT